MIREIVLDTETTGLDPGQGHRLVELAAVELVNHLPSGKTFHSYVNPEREVPDEVVRVHGLSAAFLAEFPVFAEVADPFLGFIEDCPLVIHNAGFDVRFLNHELERIGREPLAISRGKCTLVMAQRRFPGAANSLDALCRRFGVDATARKLHGALLDCQLLAEVYLHLMGGRQADLGLLVPGLAPVGDLLTAPSRQPRPPRPHAPSAEELAAHALFVARIENAIWDL